MEVSDIAFKRGSGEWRGDDVLVKKLILAEHNCNANHVIPTLWNSKVYQKLYVALHTAKCRACGGVPNDPFMCLTCGDLLCLSQACCTCPLSSSPFLNGRDNTLP